MSSAFVALNMRSMMTHVGVGMGAASFWRGAWYVLDDHLYPEEAWKSALASFGLGVAGMTASQGLVAKCEQLATRKTNSLMASRRLRVFRFGALYTIAVSCVLVWRGTWVGWDVLYEYTHPEQTPCRTGVKSTDPGHLSTSGILSHVLAVTALVGTGVFASVLAPPAATSIVRDWAVKTGSKPYSGPAGKLVQRLWSSSNTGSYSSSPAAQAVIARNFSQVPSRTASISNSTPIRTTNGRTMGNYSSSYYTTTRILPTFCNQRRG
jgi:hypothetical protein